MDKAEATRTHAIRALAENLVVLQVRVDMLTVQVEVLRQMLPLGRTEEFDRRVADIRKRAERASARAEASERSRRAKAAPRRGH